MNIDFDILKYLDVILLCINVILYSISHNQFSKIMAYKLIYIYLWLSLIITVTTEIMFAYKENNHYLSHFYFLFQFILFTYFYLNLFKNKTQKIYVKTIFVIVISILTIQYLLNPLGLFYFNLLEVLLTSFPLISYSIIHLYNSLVKKGSYLYLNAAMLVYLSASTLIFFLSNYLTGLDKKIVINIWHILEILYVLFLIIILLEWKNSFSSYKTKTQS
jgi:hypothetical protein